MRKKCAQQTLLCTVLINQITMAVPLTSQTAIDGFAYKAY